MEGSCNKEAHEILYGNLAKLYIFNMFTFLFGITVHTFYVSIKLFSLNTIIRHAFHFSILFYETIQFTALLITRLRSHLKSQSDTSFGSDNRLIGTKPTIGQVEARLYLTSVIVIKSR